MVVYNFHNPQPFARTQPSHTLFATKSVIYPFAFTISTPLTNFQNFTYNTLPLPIKPLTFPLLTNSINFAEGNFGNRRHQNVSTFLLLYYLPFLQLTSPLGVYQNPNKQKDFKSHICFYKLSILLISHIFHSSIHIYCYFHVMILVMFFNGFRLY